MKNLHLSNNPEYTIRDSHGIVTHCSIVDLDGNIVFFGPTDLVDNYWDDNITYENGKFLIDDKEVTISTLV